MSSSQPIDLCDSSGDEWSPPPLPPSLPPLIKEETPSTPSEIIIPETQQDNTSSPSSPGLSTPLRDIYSVSPSADTADDFFAPPTRLSRTTSRHLDYSTNNDPPLAIKTPSRLNLFTLHVTQDF
ncbi:hypothetical protein M231_03917 [Tremella mesenterica]|uniref:Uncharacterized protein n=1 Tax=Tremella mesenterica TaxID=5217 RepID=A0A4Q1BLR0_TREME|nr:hypothetical protein M231_03917 [Tremella mesenterica]